MLDKNSYVVKEPLTQMKGTDPVTNVLSYYRVDANGELIYRYNSNLKTWEFFREAGPFGVPNDLTSALSASDVETIQAGLINSGLFKARTQYLIVGDEPAGGKGVVDLKTRLGEQKYAEMKTLLTFLPRQYLKAWFDKTISPTLTGYANFIPMIYAAFIEVFNEANLKHVNKHQMEPWVWEETKLKNYYLAENKPVLDELNQKFAAYKELNVAPDSKAQALMIEYKKLKPLGDLGLEVSRQYAFKELLARKDYASAQGIIEAYRYADYTILGEAISSPVPFDIVDGHNTVVKASI